MAKDKEIIILNIYKINQDLKKVLGRESALYKKAMLNKDLKVKIKDGKEATEEEMWETIRITGLNSEAGKIMEKKYPKLFKEAREREKINEELHKYILVEFGFDFRQMTFCDYMKLSEAIFEYKFKKLNLK